MSKHDLKGIDTGKVGNNKYVDYTFEDYMRDTGLSRKGTIRDLEARNIFLTDLEPIVPKIKQPKNILEKVDNLLLGYNQPTEIVDGKVVGKYRPKGLLNRFTIGVMPYELLGLTDFDQRGNLFGANKASGYGGAPTNYKLPKILTDQLAAEEESKNKKEEEIKDPMGDIKEIVDETLRYKKGADTQSRKGRVLDSALEFLNYSLTSPKIFKDLRRESDYVQNRLLQAELRKQSFPDAIQARTVASGADFAQQAQAIAAQQDAATRFAGLGMQRPFGQPVIRSS